MWLGTCADTGYGCFHDRRAYSTHRYSWEIHFGSVPAGKCVLHRCDNRACVRPDHLWIGTRAENTADMLAKGRHRTAAVSGETHYLAKLTEDAVREIRSSHERGIDLAARFGVSPGLVSLVRLGRAWKHVAR